MDYRPPGWNPKKIINRAITQALEAGNFSYELLVEAGADAMLEALKETGRIIDSDTLYVLTNEGDYPICLIIIPLGGQVG